MEIAYDFSVIFPNSPIQRLDRGQLLRFHPRKFWAVQKAIDAMGEASTEAQGLKRILTTYQKVLDQEDDQFLYLMWHKHATKENVSVLVGLLKVAKKKLYLLDAAGKKQYEEKPLCILDFYVHESMQRKGNGHQLFDYMLNSESTSVGAVAIDRPSEAFLQFLKKFYKLSDPVWQSTNYVVFPEFFEDKKTVTKEDPDAPRRGARSAKQSGMITQSPQPTSRCVTRPDGASGLIHQDGPAPTRRVAGPDTPLGRKNTRDFGHQSIW